MPEPRNGQWVTDVVHPTSLSPAHTFSFSLAMAILDLDCTEIGTKVEVEVRGRRIEAEVVALPFYKKAK